MLINILAEIAYGMVEVLDSPSFQPKDSTSQTLLPILQPIADRLSATKTVLTAITVTLRSDMMGVDKDYLFHG
jgi:hypothetical protein